MPITVCTHSQEVLISNLGRDAMIEALPVLPESLQSNAGIVS
jgi:hypothetical protein